jgi:hypothetical protein
MYHHLSVVDYHLIRRQIHRLFVLLALFEDVLFVAQLIEEDVVNFLQNPVVYIHRLLTEKKKNFDSELTVCSLYRNVF